MRKQTESSYMAETRHYLFDAALRIWLTAAHAGSTYSDGEAFEQGLLLTLQRCRDVSTTSAELLAQIVDWPTEYHLSPARHHLLRPITFGPSDRILELGCGCGSMTRFLGETGAQVVAVEGSQLRAAIAAERCRDLPNVVVYCDNLIDFQTDADFNFVTLVGVLEYSRRFISGPDPVQSCLEKAGSFLAQDGSLVIAIENQLGLKYFNGCSEDHMGKSYFGINGLYRENDPVTLGRFALANRLELSGFPIHEFLYPFPDYKMPGLILSSDALTSSLLNVGDLLIHNIGRDYPETHHRAFAEDLAWRVVGENNLLADLANSFLVLAQRAGSNHAAVDWLAKIYSRGRRHPCYQVEATIAEDELGKLAVRKRVLYPDLPAVDEWLSHNPLNSTYISGNLLIGKVHKAMALEAPAKEIAACFKPWLDYLIANAIRGTSNELTLPGNFVDCIPANMIEDNVGELRYFDAEWVGKERIPMVWAVIRGIVYSLTGCLENSALRQTTYRQFVTAVAEAGGLVLSSADFVVADLWEAKLVAQCHADVATTPRLATFYDEPLYLIFRLSGHVPELRLRVARYEAEVARIKRTVSWRITAPLRVVWNAYQKLIGNRVDA